MMFPRGSEWRRWDLHVHTPGTAREDEFGSWDEYLEAIEGQDEVRVIGVTDYYTITNYSKLKAEKEGGRLQNVDLLIPNIEFRIAPPSDKATALNIHLIISPDDPEHEKKITSALGRLSWEYNGHLYSCLPDELINLGRAFDGSQTSDSAALSTGVLQYKIDFSTLRDWLKRENWLRENSLVVAAAGKDGLSGFQQDGSWGGFREEITRFSDMIFSGRPGERVFWLGQRKPEEDLPTIEKLGGFKPCIHGSDAHKLEKLFKPDEDRFCWIKADPTFEGLRQVLYEPEDRVFIGPTPPVLHDEARVIRDVTLSSGGGWFENATVPVNPGLTAIIGQKGAGKSALAEVISYCSGSWETQDKGSFLNRAGTLLKGLEVELTWASGEKTKVKLGDEQSGDERVRYLSQRFVERLCSEDHIGEDLIREIEAVVFSYIDTSDTLDASNFSELRNLKTKGVKQEANRLREEVLRLIREEVLLRDNAAKVPEKEKRIEALQLEKEGLVKQLPAPVSKDEEEVRDQIQVLQDRLAGAEQESAVDKQKLQKLDDARTRVAAFRSEMHRFATEIDGILKDAGVDEAGRTSFVPMFSGDTEAPILQREGEIKQTLSKRQGDGENPEDGTINWTRKQIETLMRKEFADRARQKKVMLTRERITKINTEVGRIKREIEQVNTVEKERIKEARDERLESYKAYFENLRKEQKVLEELYAPVSERLSSDDAIEQERDLKLSIRWVADVDTWLKRGSALFDQRKALPYGTVQDLGAAAREILVPAWISGNADAIIPAMNSFLEEFRKTPPKNYMRSGVSVQDIYEWLFEVQHVRLNYGLKYNDVDLEKLSPGTKGIVLLILYLGMDVADTRPLIVDQPDENLDNESIFKLLTAYFKQAKKRRQIILISHNPNLVVNADAEQVIIATSDKRADGLPHIKYFSGSLENNKPEKNCVRFHVCRILEGGQDAFRKREVRYDI